MAPMTNLPEGVVRHFNYAAGLSETECRRRRVGEIELRHLRYFLAIAELTSFTKASERLGVSQPTLSHQIKQLEGRLGAVLFHRVARHAELTACGAAFHSYCERIMKELENGTLAVSELQGMVRGTLRIAVFHSFSTSLLGPVFAKFALQYPGIRLVARLVPRREMERDLLSGALDLAVAYVPEGNEHIVAETLFNEELVLIVGRGHRLARRTSLPMRALADLDLILLTDEFGIRQFLDKFFAREKLNPRIALEMNAIEPMLAIVREAALATVLSDGVITKSMDLRVVRLVQPTPLRSCAILWRREGHRQAAAIRMAEMIRAAYQKGGKIQPLTKRPGKTREAKTDSTPDARIC